MYSFETEIDAQAYALCCRFYIICDLFLFFSLNYKHHTVLNQGKHKIAKKYILRYVGLDGVFLCRLCKSFVLYTYINWMEEFISRWMHEDHDDKDCEE